MPLEKLSKELLELDIEPQVRQSPKYIEKMVEITRLITMLEESVLRNIDMSQIKGSSGHYVIFKLGREDVPVDVLFLVELPKWLRERALSAYDDLIQSLSSEAKHPSLEHQRLFSELKQVQTTDSYPSIYDSDINAYVTYCMQHFKKEAKSVSQKIMKGKLSEADHSASKLRHITNLMKHPIRALFRLEYLSKEFEEEKNPRIKKALGSGYFQGCGESIEHFLKTTPAGINHAIKSVEHLMSDLLGVSEKEASSPNFPGAFIWGELEDDHLEKLRAIKNGWDQLKYQVFEELKASFDAKKYRDKLEKLVDDYDKKEIGGQGFIQGCWLVLRAVEKRIHSSQEPSGWVHQALKLDLRLKKVTDQEQDEHFGWIYENLAALLALAPDILMHMEETVEKGDAIPNRQFSEVLEAFKNGQLFSRESVTEEFQRLFSERNFQPHSYKFDDIQDNEDDGDNFEDLLILHNKVLTKLNNMNLHDTQFYGKLIAAFPNHKEREDELLRFYPKLRGFKELEEEIRKEIILRYDDIQQMEQLSPETFHHLVRVMEQSAVKGILQGNYKLIEASQFRARFKKIQTISDVHVQAQQLILLEKMVSVVPPAEMIKKYQSSAFTQQTPSTLDLRNNENELKELYIVIMKQPPVSSKREALLFEILDMEQFRWKKMQKDLNLLKASFIDVLELNPNDPLADSYRILKEDIFKGQFGLRSARRAALFKRYNTELSKYDIDKAFFEEVLDKNVEKLDELMKDANDGLINLKCYHQELGSKDVFAYLEEVLDSAQQEAACDQFSLKVDMPYVYLQRFIALHCNRNRMMDDLVTRAITQPWEIPKKLLEKLNRPAAERFLKENRKLSANIKLQILFNMQSHLGTELRYLSYLTNFAEKESFLSLTAIKSLVAMFKLIHRDFDHLKALRRLRGSLRTELLSSYKPETHQIYFFLNRKQLFDKIQEVTKDKLEIANA